MNLNESIYYKKYKKYKTKYQIYKNKMRGGDDVIMIKTDNNNNIESFIFDYGKVDTDIKQLFDMLPDKHKGNPSLYYRVQNTNDYEYIPNIYIYTCKNLNITNNNYYKTKDITEYIYDLLTRCNMTLSSIDDENITTQIRNKMNNEKIERETESNKIKTDIEKNNIIVNMIKFINIFYDYTQNNTYYDKIKRIKEFTVSESIVKIFDDKFNDDTQLNNLKNEIHKKEQELISTSKMFVPIPVKVNILWTKLTEEEQQLFNDYIEIYDEYNKQKNDVLYLYTKGVYKYKDIIEYLIYLINSLKDISDDKLETYNTGIINIIQYTQLVNMFRYSKMESFVSFLTYIFNILNRPYNDIYNKEDDIYYIYKYLNQT